MAMSESENHVAGTGGGTSEVIDIESYASLYTGHTRIARLHFIADHCNVVSRNLELEALRMAFDEIKKGENTSLFKECVEKINGRLGSNYTLDQEWIDMVERRAAQRQEKLDMELNGYKVRFELIDYVLYCLGFRIEGGCHTTRGNTILCRIIRVSRGIENFEFSY
jgi:COP9 signalosome complex subunit 1